MGILLRYEEQIYALMRFVTGTLFACHGAQKLFGVLGGTVASTPRMLLGGVIELAGGALMAAGLFTSLAAFLSSGTMAVAYFTAHAHRGFWPVVNKGELAVAYCFLFLYVAAHGSGPYSLDRLLQKRLRKTG